MTKTISPLGLGFFAASRKIEDKETGSLSLIDLFESYSAKVPPDANLQSDSTGLTDPFVLIAMWYSPEAAKASSSFDLELSLIREGEEDEKVILQSALEFKKSRHRLLFKFEGIPVRVASGTLWFECRIRLRESDTSPWIKQRFPLSVEIDRNV